jgi:hypothetical protein
MILEIPTDSAAQTARSVLATARRIGAVFAIMLWVVGQSGCLSGGETKIDPLDLEPEQRDQQIEALKESIERDRAALAEWIAQPDSEYSTALHDDPEMRTLASRLAEQVEDLEQLEAARRTVRRRNDSAGQTRESANQR